ncbi:MAG: STAS domain-containing protein [Desulfobacteraceae bacterium]|nr:STAS domain-containing protein [Desulfobacteraceae bacterium]
MEVTVVRGEGRLTVTVAGMIDEEGADRLKETFDQVLGTTLLPVVVLDLRGTQHIGSSGIGKILLFYKNLSIKNSRLEVINLNPGLHELFRELKLDTLFAVSGV